MNVYLISDTHFNHANISTYCQRPTNFSDIILRNLRNTLRDEDTLIHLGDVFIGEFPPYLCDWPGRKILVRGNHDRNHSPTWWMEHGFDFACDGLMFRNWWLTHEPASCLPWPEHGSGNIHGHLHNIWHGFGDWPEGHRERDAEILGKEPTARLKYEYQRLFAVEYTNYMPVEFNKFISHPEKYQSQGPKG